MKTRHIYLRHTFERIAPHSLLTCARMRLLIIVLTCFCAKAFAYGKSSSPCSSKSKCGKAGKINPYSYSYTAPVGVYSDGLIMAAESSDGSGTVTGSYSLMDPDGRMRYVYYKGKCHTATQHAEMLSCSGQDWLSCNCEDERARHGERESGRCCNAVILRYAVIRRR